MPWLNACVRTCRYRRSAQTTSSRRHAARRESGPRLRLAAHRGVLRRRQRGIRAGRRDAAAVLQALPWRGRLGGACEERWELSAACEVSVHGAEDGLCLRYGRPLAHDGQCELHDQVAERRWLDGVRYLHVYACAGLNNK